MGVCLNHERPKVSKGHCRNFEDAFLISIKLFQTKNFWKKLDCQVVGAIFRWKNQVEKSSQAYTWLQPMVHGPKTWLRLAEESSRKTCEKMEKIQDPQQTNGVLVANWAFHSSIAVHSSLPGKSTIKRIFGFHKVLRKIVVYFYPVLRPFFLMRGTLNSCESFRIVVETNTDTGSIHIPLRGLP